MALELYELGATMAGEACCRGDNCRTCENAACSSAEKSDPELLGPGATIGAELPTIGGVAGRSRREAPPTVLLLITEPLRTDPLKLEEVAEVGLRCKREGARGGALPWAETLKILPTLPNKTEETSATDISGLTFIN